MVDVGSKADSQRMAVAEGRVYMNEIAFEAVRDGTVKKGDVLTVARIAGIMAAKKTSDLIPLCHPLMISGVTVEIDHTEAVVSIAVTVRVHDRTGVEMEAMTGASIGALALYDMIKGIDRSAEITSVRLEHKAGGRSGEWHRGE